MKFYGKYSFNELNRRTQVGFIAGMSLTILVVLSLVVMLLRDVDVTPTRRNDSTVVRVCPALGKALSSSRVEAAFRIHTELGAPAIKSFVWDTPCRYTASCEAVDGAGEIWIDIWNPDCAVAGRDAWTKTLSRNGEIVWSGMFFQTGANPFSEMDSLLEHEISHARGFSDVGGLPTGHLLHHTPMTHKGGRRGWNTAFMSEAYSNLYEDKND